MAKAAFVYAPTRESNDMVQCLYCQLALDGWKSTDDPNDEHFQRAPNCIALTGHVKVISVFLDI